MRAEAVVDVLTKGTLGVIRLIVVQPPRSLRPQLCDAHDDLRIAP